VGALNEIERNGRGLKARLPFFLLPLPGTEEGEGRRRRRQFRRLQGTVAAEGRGKTERGARRIDSPTHHELGWRKAAWPRWPAAAGGGACGGGDAGPGRGLGTAVEVMVVVERDVGGYL
jgi:hypothetical protein